MHRLLSIFLCGFIFLMTASCVYASTPQNVQEAFNNVPQEVQQAANDGIKNFYDVINHEKTHYGLNDTDNAENVTLGIGHAVYVPSINVVKDYDSKINLTPSSSKLFTKENLYVFPINIGKKPAGIMFVAMFEGKWQAVKIASYLDFQKDLKEAQDNLNSILGSQTSPSALKLVFDQSTHLIALATEGTNDDFIIPLQGNSNLEIEKNKKMTIKDLANELSKSYINSNNVNSANIKFGSSNGLTAVMENHVWEWLSFIIVIFGVATFILYKRKLAKQ